MTEGSNRVRSTATGSARPEWSARFSWNKRTPDDLVRAADYFSQAIRADSSYARAWSGLADS
jgi:hypothetical protein